MIPWGLRAPIEMKSVGFVKNRTSFRGILEELEVMVMNNDSVHASWISKDLVRQ